MQAIVFEYKPGYLLQGLHRFQGQVNQVLGPRYSATLLECIEMLGSGEITREEYDRLTQPILSRSVRYATSKKRKSRST